MCQMGIGIRVMPSSINVVIIQATKVSFFVLSARLEFLKYRNRP